VQTYKGTVASESCVLELEISVLELVHNLWTQLGESPALIQI
jgi:hypothetical protein